MLFEVVPDLMRVPDDDVLVNAKDRLLRGETLFVADDAIVDPLTKDKLQTMVSVFAARNGATPSFRRDFFGGKKGTVIWLVLPPA